MIILLPRIHKVPGFNLQNAKACISYVHIFLNMILMLRPLFIVPHLSYVLVSFQLLMFKDRRKAVDLDLNRPLQDMS